MFAILKCAIENLIFKNVIKRLAKSQFSLKNTSLPAI